MVDGARADGRRVAVASVAAGGLTTIEIIPFARGQEGRRPINSGDAVAGVDPQETNSEETNDAPTGER